MTPLKIIIAHPLGKFWMLPNLFFCCVTVKTIFRLLGRPRSWVSINDVMFHLPLRANTCYFCFSFQDGAVSLPVSRGDRRLYWASLANEAAGVWSTGEGWCLYYSRSVFISKSCCVLKVPAETLVMYLNFFLSTIESQKTLSTQNFKYCQLVPDVLAFIVTVEHTFKHV